MKTCYRPSTDPDFAIHLAYQLILSWPSPTSDSVAAHDAGLESPVEAETGETRVIMGDACQDT